MKISKQNKKTLKQKSDLKIISPIVIAKNTEKNSTANALNGGCLLKPQSKLLPQANASIVSKGKLVLVNEGTNVHSNKCEKRNK